MSEPKEKNWWEVNVEDAWEEQARREHEMLENTPIEQFRSDVGYGLQRGTYNVAKGLAVGLFDLAKLAVNVTRGDPETYQKIWDITSKIAKESYISQFGTPQEQLDQNRRVLEAMKAIGGHIKDEMSKEWDRAVKEGRQAALISRWLTEGVLNIAAFFVGAGELKAAANAAKGADLVEIANIVAKCPKVMAAEKALKEAQVLQDAAAIAKAKKQVEMAQRLAANAELRKSAQYARDMEKAKVTPRDIELMAAKKKPLSFKSEEQFARFKEEMRAAMQEDGLVDGTVGMKGTSTTFYSENPGKPLGHHFDKNPIDLADVDLDITSDSMIQKMKSKNIEVNPKYGNYRADDMSEQFPALDKFRQKWGKELGRPVNIVGKGAPAPRDPTEFVW